MFPGLPANAKFVADRDTKNVSDFVQKHFVSATNVSQFGQPIRNIGANTLFISFKTSVLRFIFYIFMVQINVVVVLLKPCISKILR